MIQDIKNKANQLKGLAEDLENSITDVLSKFKNDSAIPKETLDKANSFVSQALSFAKKGDAESINNLIKDFKDGRKDN
jgi:gas vesicle protein